jgi:hypothetical protein
MDKSRQQQKEMTKQGDDAHVNKLPDDLLVRILSLLPYTEAVQTASVSRRWEDVVLRQLPTLEFSMPLPRHWLASRGTPSEQRVQSMERTLRRRCGEGARDVVKHLSLFFRKDVPMECRYADEFITLANAHELRLIVLFQQGISSTADSGAWCLELPPATTVLHVRPNSYAVRPPHIHGPAVATLRCLTLKGPTVLGQDFLGIKLPSLEVLHIGDCSIAASICITSDTMPRLRHLEITDVAVMPKDTRPGITVLADELRTLRVSCYRGSRTEPFDMNMGWNDTPRRFRASFTSYSSFRVRAPRLRVFDWRCCYADEIYIENIGHLWNVVVDLAAGQKVRRKYHEEVSYVTVDQRDELMRNILQGLMPGLRPLNWEDIKRYVLVDLAMLKEKLGL